MRASIRRAALYATLCTVFAASALAFVPTLASADPTDITVRVLGKDSKFVGSSMGGARVIVRDADTREILAQGVTSGSTGDTKRIMGPQDDSRSLRSSEGAAKFVATIDIDAPRLVEVEAFGPLAQPQAAHSVSATQWVVPGRHVSGGDGWVLELPGYVVDVLAPPAHVKLPPETASVELRANVALMCGCPITPGGLWDADTLEVKALIKHNGEDLPPVDLAFAGETSQFKATVPVAAPGLYDVTVYAHNADNGNTGLDRTTFIVSE